jgi:hypothetical protein
MFQIGNIVTVTNDSISYRLNDPKLSAIFSGYAYSSEKKLTGKRCRIVNMIDETITKDGVDEVTHYVAIQNLESKYKEVYLVDEAVVEEVDTEMTVAEIEKVTGISPIAVDTEVGEVTIEYPSLKNCLVKLVNGSIYYGTDTSLVNKNYEHPYDTYDPELHSLENPSFDVDKVYEVLNPKQIVTLNVTDSPLLWARPTIMTLTEISNMVGYKVVLKEN